MKPRDKLIQSVKLGIASLAHYSGLLNIHRNSLMKKKGVVLLYHRITDGNDMVDYAPYGMSVTPATFDAHMAFLSKNYNVVPLSELTDLLEQDKPIPDKLCVITFDDGWLDNYTTAYPILKKYDLPATIFLATNYMDRKPGFWEERVLYLLAHIYQNRNKISNTELKKKLDQFFLQFKLNDLFDQTHYSLPLFLMNYVKQLREGDASARTEIIEQLENLILHTELKEPRRFLNWQEIKEMASNKIEFGAHSLSHVSLPQCDTEKAHTEIAESKKCIEQHLETTVKEFAYPYGKYTEETIEQLKSTNFSCAYTTVPGFITLKQNKFKLPRIDIYQDVSFTSAFFACRILSFMGKY